MSKTKHQLWQSTLEHRSGSPFSLTSPRLLAGLLAVQSGTKTHILNKTMLLRCWRGIATSKRLFTGLRLMLLFLDFPEETRKLLGPGTLAEGALTGTYSTRPSSTTFEILTPDRDVESSDDGLIPPTAYHCSCESFNILRRSRASLTHPQTSATT